MNRTSFLRTVAVATLLTTGAGAAVAGECPEDQVVAASMTGDGHGENKGVTDTVLAVNDLGTYHPELASRVQRIRMLTVEPGGEVAWHGHEDRPALIYIVEGSITEYRSTCAVPIEHGAGEVAAEIGPLAHWWRNNGTEPAQLISSDLPRAEIQPRTM